jgi:tocopherol cyclase
MFHGHGLKHNFFEGWYFKFADAAERHVWAVIPGVFLAASSQSEQESHSFVQTVDGQSSETHYHRYPLQEFWASPTDFDVRIGPNRFRSDFLSLDIARPEQTISGTLYFKGTVPWPVTLTSPGIMGWYAFVPFMECYHGVLSLDHEVFGHLKLRGQDVDFTGGRGYIEKDWGQSFPRGWVWMQTNHFAAPGTSLTASVGRIPWLRSAFRGFIIGLWHHGQLYRFATYTGANLVDLKITDTQVRMQVQDARYRLEIEAVRSKGGLVHAPFREGMLQRLSESLTAKVFVRLSQRSPSREIFSGTGRHAGLEVGGEVDLIAD